MSLVRSQRGLVKIKHEEGFWGVYIPSTEEFLVSVSLGNVRKTIFEHFDVEKIPRPDVEVITGDDEEYDKLIKSYKKQIHSTKKIDPEGPVPEVLQVLTRFANQGVHIRDVANFFGTTQKHVNELLGKK